MVGVSEVTDSGASSRDLDGSWGVGGFGGGDLGGGVGGVNYMSTSLR